MRTISGIKSSLLICVALVFLNGCDLLLSPEEKINLAVPLSEEVTITKIRVESRLPTQQTEQFEEMFRTKLKLRALTCGGGYVPSWLDSPENVAQRLQDTSCFRDHDKKLLLWLKLRLVGIVSSAPPIAPIPKGPFNYPLDGKPTAIYFADNAGVVLLQNSQETRIVEMVNRQILFSEKNYNKTAGALSPNGRVFTTSINRVQHELRSSEDGGLLLELPATYYGTELFWLNNDMVLYNSDQEKVKLIDFAQGKIVDIDELKGNLIDVFPTSGSNDEFLVMTNRMSSRVRKYTGTGNLDVTFLSSARTAPGTMVKTQKQSVTSDLKRRFSRSYNSSLLLNSVDVQEEEKVEFLPIRLLTASPAVDPDKIVLDMIPVGSMRHDRFLYSVSTKKLGRIVLENPDNLLGILYVPSLKKNLLIRRNQIESVTGFPVSEEIEVDDLLNEARLQESLRKLELKEKHQARISRPGKPRIVGAPSYTTSSSLGGAPKAERFECSNPRTNKEITQCIGQELRAEDSMLNSVYQSLMSQLSAENKTELRSAQRKWIELRNEVCELNIKESDREKWYQGVLQDHLKTICVTKSTQRRIKELKTIARYLSMVPGSKIVIDTPMPAVGSGSSFGASFDNKQSTKHSSGKWYFELQVDYAKAVRIGPVYLAIGVSDKKHFTGTMDNIRKSDATKKSVLYGIAIDLDAGKLYYSRNGTWIDGAPGSGGGQSIKPSRDYYALFALSVDSTASYLSQNAIVPNFGDTAMVSLPQGYKTWRNKGQSRKVLTPK